MSEVSSVTALMTSTGSCCDSMATDSHHLAVGRRLGVLIGRFTASMKFAAAPKFGALLSKAGVRAIQRTGQRPFAPSQLEATMVHRRLAPALLSAFACASLLLTGCGSSSNETTSDTGGGGAKKIALLLPETKTTRYESQDRPLFEAKVKDLCSDCDVLYSNADQDASKQQSQAEAALAN